MLELELEDHKYYLLLRFLAINFSATLLLMETTIKKRPRRGSKLIMPQFNG
jgi:hypothetical protein